MKYVQYCKVCDMITGHDAKMFKSSCMKCHTEKKTPIVRWLAGVLLIGSISAFLFWSTIVSLRLILGW
jgi:hypothetical protein